MSRELWAEPSPIELVQELRKSLGLFDGAMPITPKAAWEEALTVVGELRKGLCYRCMEKESLDFDAIWTRYYDISTRRFEPGLTYNELYEVVYGEKKEEE